MSQDVKAAGRGGDGGYSVATRWDFDRRDDREGWNVPEPLSGRVVGGCLRITPAGEPKAGKPDPLLRLSCFNWFPLCIESPPIRVPRAAAAKLRIRLLNLSSETDGAVHWRASDDPVRERRSSFPMRPYCRDWQEIVCHLDETPWEGDLQALRIAVGINGAGGDIHVDWIAVTDGLPRVRPVRPDIRKGRVPLVDIPGVAGADAQAAYDVLNDAVVWDPIPTFGFPYPFLSPGADGAGYGFNWWLLDAGLTVPALRWTDLGFCENMMRGFIAAQDQNPDGRINHEGKVAWRGHPGDVSVIPRYFEQVGLTAAVTADGDLPRQLYDSAARYLDWWLSPVKRDARTGLVTGYFEESFTGNYAFAPGEVAPVDTNVAVALGCHVCAALAQRLGFPEAAARHRRQFEALTHAINAVLWNEEDGCYCNWSVRDGRHVRLMAGHMFDTFRLGIAPPERRERLFAKLLDPVLFQWGGIGLTTLARTDPNFKVHRGTYGAGAWDGGIWTMRNIVIVEGLRDVGRHDLAAELAWMTVRLFAGNYAEFLDPDEGKAQGVKRYCWSAAQWLETVISHLFGVAYDTRERRLCLFPHIPKALHGKPLGIRGLCLSPSSSRLHLNLVSHADGGMEADVRVEGSLPPGTTMDMAVPAPAGAKGLRVDGVNPATVEFRPHSGVGWVRLDPARAARMKWVWT